MLIINEIHNALHVHSYLESLRFLRRVDFCIKRCAYAHIYNCMQTNTNTHTFKQIFQSRHRIHAECIHSLDFTEYVCVNEEERIKRNDWAISQYFRLCWIDLDGNQFIFKIVLLTVIIRTTQVFKLILNGIRQKEYLYGLAAAAAEAETTTDLQM